MLLILFIGLAFAQNPSSFVSPGDLAEDHQHLSGLTQCTECHTLGVGLDHGKCLDCHDSVKEQVEQEKGFHSDKPAACEACHDDHRGVGFDMVNLDEESFDHDETGFSLEGSHARAECEDCHEEGAWTGIEPVCASCHDEPHGAEDSTRPLLGQCESCHGVEDWDVVELATSVFDHSSPKQADYALEGEHEDVACEACHAEWKFVPTEADACEDCHEDMHNHQFGERTCDDCHTVNVAAFALRNYDHDTTDYPLHGQHVGVSCESCHGDKERAKYVDLPHERCGTCHEDPHDGQFDPRDCDSCHTLASAGFELPDINHDETDFPLVRAHIDVACEDCHGAGDEAQFADLPFDDCATCHEDPHEEQFQPQRCDSCHLDGTWETESFDHALADYPLEGAHEAVACEDCHTVAGEHVLSPIAFETCLDCHAEEEPHQGHFKGAQCEDCHTISTWDTLHFDHLAATEFALVDGHDLACAECHSEPTYTDAEPACETCHDPPPAHFEGPCAECHLPVDWNQASLGEQGHDVTGFPLRAAHDRIECSECHTPGRPAHDASTFCADCHRSDDPHRNMLGNTCQDCHGPSDWSRTRFAHAITGWPLRGSHKLATCNDCHATGFVGTPQECFRCHNNEKPRDNIHQSAGTNDCGICHRPYDWDNALNPHGNR